jgi:hypothetical protein
MPLLEGLLTLRLRKDTFPCSAHNTLHKPTLVFSARATWRTAHRSTARRPWRSSDHRHVDYFQSLEKFREPGLPCAPPAHFEDRLKNDARLLELKSDVHAIKRQESSGSSLKEAKGPTSQLPQTPQADDAPTLPRKLDPRSQRLEDSHSRHRRGR